MHVTFLRSLAGMIYNTAAWPAVSGSQVAVQQGCAVGCAIAVDCTMCALNPLGR